MSSPDSTSLEEFRARLPIGEIVGRHVRLQRRGRELVGLCPFHKERTPSFTVVEDKGFYHCFGCGAHGNAIDFVMAQEGLAFAEALERLESLTGIKAPRRQGTEAERERGRDLRAALAAAAHWFQGQIETSAAAAARAYLAGRGLERDAVQRFGLGFAPGGRDGLKRALEAEGFALAVLIEAGLLIQPEDGGAAFDRFRERVMFPIEDGQGRVVGFGGRALGDAQPKYLNSPETPLFQKRLLLYGLARARRPARERRRLVVAEGYMDVIALARAGIEEAVAPLGTAVSEEQLALLWQHADEPIVCLDGDAAGLRAAERLAERALARLAAGKSLRFALLPEGEDPDSLLRKRGASALQRRLDEAVGLVDFLWTRATAMRGFDTPERRAALRGRLRGLAGTIPDRSLAGLFRDAFEERFRARFPSPWQRAQRADRLPRPAPGPSRLRDSPSADYARERRLLAPILAAPGLLVEIEEELAALELLEPSLERLRQEIFAWYTSCGRLDAKDLEDHLCRSGLGALVERLGRDATEARGSGPEPGAALEHWRKMAAEHGSHAALRQERQAWLAAEDEEPEEQRAIMERMGSLRNAPPVTTELPQGDDELLKDRMTLDESLRHFSRLASGRGAVAADDGGPTGEGEEAR